MIFPHKKPNDGCVGPRALGAASVRPLPRHAVVVRVTRTRRCARGRRGAAGRQRDAAARGSGRGPATPTHPRRRGTSTRRRPDESARRGRRTGGRRGGPRCAESKRACSRCCCTRKCNEPQPTCTRTTSRQGRTSSVTSAASKIGNFRGRLHFRWTTPRPADVCCMPTSYPSSHRLRRKHSSCIERHIISRVTKSRLPLFCERLTSKPVS